ncbi:MAG TPA: transglutaminase family protein [Planctomycetaceae bacterium]|nr:transglutaminase family protein [Planctomycetaceae bacterium]
MHYKITHTTTYLYSETVPVCHNEVHLTPREGRAQTCRHHRLAIKPRPTTLSKRIDFFGNQCHYFSILEGHKKLSVQAVSRVDVKPCTTPVVENSHPWEVVRDLVQRDLSPANIEALQHVFPSPSVSLPDSVRDYAAPCFSAGRPILSAVRELTSRIYRDFRYDPQATTISTPVQKVLELRRGVCQDFAHLGIAALRSLGLPARYVSGYLRTMPQPGRPRLIGADASHAWLSVYIGDGGWVDVDPTNDCFTGTDHITVAWGRDYTDVCPIKGVFIGGGSGDAHRMTVSVDVLPITDDHPAHGNGLAEHDMDQ